jgi:hypothetical protein
MTDAQTPAGGVDQVDVDQADQAILEISSGAVVVEVIGPGGNVTERLQLPAGEPVRLPYSTVRVVPAGELDQPDTAEPAGELVDQPQREGEPA